MNGKFLKITFIFILLAQVLFRVPAFAAETAPLAVRVGIFDYKGFYGTDENGNPYGYGYEYLDMLARHGRFIFELRYGSWAQCLEWLREGKVDMLNSAQWTEDRAREFAYSKYATGMSFGKIFVKSDNNKIAYNDFDAMNGLRVGLLKGNSRNTSFRAFAEKSGFTTNDVIYDTTQELASALQDGEVDAVVTSNLRRADGERPVARFAPMPFYIITRKDDIALKEAIDEAIEDILIENPNFNAQLHMKYYQIDSSTVVLTKPEQDYIKNSPTIRVAYDSKKPPFESYDEETGAPRGVNVDILKLISEKTGLRFEFLHGYDGDGAMRALAERKADMLLSYITNYKKAAEQNVRLTDNFLTPEQCNVLGAKQTGSLSFALAGDENPLLVSILNKTIAAILASDLDSLLLNYTTNRVVETEASSRRTVMTAVTAAAALIILTLLAVIVMQRRNRKKLWKMAFIDSLVGCSNYNKFKHDAQKLLSQNKGTRYICTIIDIDNFKLINEMYGFDEGDKIIKNMGKAIESILAPESDTYGRVYSDHFAVLKSYSTPEESERTRAKLEREFFESIGGDIGHIIVSRFGRYFLEPGDADIISVLEKSNYAHGIAKSQAHSNVCNYDDAMRRVEIREKQIENKMEASLNADQFKVYLQAKHSLADESVVGAEALVRWQEDGKDVIYPSEFIPLFEKNGFVIKLDMYMLKKACEIIRGWMESGLPLVTISVNFSRLHLRNEDFVQEIIKIADAHGIPRKYLEVEITESAMLDSEIALETILTKLHDAGFTLSMDDFGTGYSSLGLLKNLPIDVIKIDRSFFSDNKDKARARTVIENVIRMAKELGIHTVAEGVESFEHIAFLYDVGCEAVQGYYYARPIPAENFQQKKAFI